MSNPLLCTFSYNEHRITSGLSSLSAVTEGAKSRGPLPLSLAKGKNMRYFLFALLFSIVSISAQASELPSRENLIAAALDDYGKVAAAWFLNERCKYINEEERIKFKDNVALITGALGKDLGGPQMLYMVQGGAKKATEQSKYEKCDGEAKELFDYGYKHSRNWSNQIRKLQNR